MYCNCKWTETVLALVILAFVILPTQIVSQTYSWWIVVVAAALLLIHAWVCMSCGKCSTHKTSSPGRRSSRRSSRRSRRKR